MCLHACKPVGIFFSEFCLQSQLVSTILTREGSDEPCQSFVPDQERMRCPSQPVVSPVQCGATGRGAGDRAAVALCVRSSRSTPPKEMSHVSLKFGQAAQAIAPVSSGRGA